MPGIKIREARRDEYRAVAILFRLVRERCLPYLPRRYEPAADAAFFRDHVFTDCTVWLAEGAEILGFCAFRPGWVDHLYIHPDRHAQGLGRALLARAQAAEPMLQLWVFQRNHRAIRFYEAAGFRRVEATDGARNEEKTPDARYRWDRERPALAR
jgi:GNAT superfamily N-acetyltransferase